MFNTNIILVQLKSTVSERGIVMAMNSVTLFRVIPNKGLVGSASRARASLVGKSVQLNPAYKDADKVFPKLHKCGTFSVLADHVRKAHDGTVTRLIKVRDINGNEAATDAARFNVAEPVKGFIGWLENLELRVSNSLLRMNAR